MSFPMGCGGSRADAIIEPRYHESWTRETESTWLTNTDVEAPLPAANGKALDAGPKERRMVNTGTQCGKQPPGPPGPPGPAAAAAAPLGQRKARRSLSEQSASKPRPSKEARAPAANHVDDAGPAAAGDAEAAEDER